MHYTCWWKKANVFRTRLLKYHCETLFSKSCSLGHGPPVFWPHGLQLPPALARPVLSPCSPVKTLNYYTSKTVTVQNADLLHVYSRYLMSTYRWFNKKLEMWANAQRDGCPGEYRLCPLFNAAKFGWRPLLECRAVTLPRRETRWNLQGCPKLTKRYQPLVGRSSPYYGNMWRRYCCLTSFFPLSIHALVAKI